MYNNNETLNKIETGSLEFRKSACKKTEKCV